MYINPDNDFQCITCAKILIREVEFEYDTREGKIRDNKKKGDGGNLDQTSRMGKEGAWVRRTSNYDSTLAQQRGLGRANRGLSSRR